MQDTRTHILDTAQQLTSLRGFDAFSYRDIAAAVDVKTSSIHYYFPTKSDLAAALIDRYTTAAETALNDITASGKNAYIQLKAFFSMICSLSGTEKHFCLCGMLSANVHTIANDSKKNLERFFDLMESWTEKKIKEGIKDGSLNASLRPKNSATEIAAIIEGAMLIARVKDTGNYLQTTLDITLSRLRA